MEGRLIQMAAARKSKVKVKNADKQGRNQSRQTRMNFTLTLSSMHENSFCSLQTLALKYLRSG